MTKKMMLLAVTAVAALAFAAMPAIASAAPTVDFSKPTPLPFTGKSTVSFLRSSGFAQTVECTSDHVKGEWTTGTTGHIHLLFTGCKNTSTGIACNTTGLASGEITVRSSLFHLVYIKGFTKTVGALVTPPVEGEKTLPFAEFSCGSLFKVVVTGNGIIGHVTKPACGETSTGSTIVAQSASLNSVQKYQEIEGSTTKYHLLSSLNGGTAGEASEETTEETTLEGEATGTLTCL
ncbi:MAG: hypothetical protein ACTHN3_10090 [Solirubrobacterales bacterium]